MDEEKASAACHGLDDTCKSRAEKIYYQAELRALELKAYSGVLEALRASGKPNSEKDGVIKTLRDYFKVPDDRHKAEIRQLAFDDKLSTISKKITGYTSNEDWAYLAQRKYVPMGLPPYSFFRSFPTSLSRTCKTIRDPLPIRKNKSSYLDEDSDVHSDTELELINNLIRDIPVYNGCPPEHPIPVQVAVETGTGNEEEMDEMELQIKKKLKFRKHQNARASSPDITDTPRHVNKLSVKGETKLAHTVKGRGIKRKGTDEYKLPQDANFIKSEPAKGRYRVKKLSKTQDQLKTSKYHQVSGVEERKVSSEETSSADEGENGNSTMDDSSRVLSPVFSEVIRSSVFNRAPKAPRGQGAHARKKNGSTISPSKIKGARVRPRTPNQKSAKFRNVTPTSGSRRKSKLNEKIDYDDVLMDLDGNELEKQAVYSSKGDEISRRLLLDSQAFDGRTPLKEDTGMFSEPLPNNYNHDELEQVNDGVFKRPLPPSRGPKPWEIKDARLSHRDDSISDENNSSSVHFGEIEISHQQQPTLDLGVQHANYNDASTPTTPSKHELPPPPKKQRLKSPLLINPSINPSNMSKVPIPSPVFSTSISSISKKRQNTKPVSVVDSLNLHLPTSPTASSLAASSNNRRSAATNSGCSMFSNSTALIAGARGTAPGILQQQRKAQPHILANSKAHQRAFTPTINSCSSLSPNVSSGVVSPVTVASTYPAGALSPNSPVPSAQNAPHTVQLPASSIPISALSTSPPSSATISYPNFPTPNATTLSIGTPGVPIAHVNRPSTGPNIILVQKSNGPTVAGGVAPTHNAIPVKTQPRAVILRRAQLPRQPGNVMILDMQNNQLVAPCQPPILQTARILNAPTELSVVNIQSSTNPVPCVVSDTSIMPSQTYLPSDSVPIQDSMISAHPQKPEEKIMVTASHESFQGNLTPISQTNHTSGETTSDLCSSEELEGNKNDEHPATVTEPVPQDAEYAQIEAELMQMEEGSFEEVVYEEEVTTEIVPLDEGSSTEYIYTNDTCASESETLLGPQEVSVQTPASIISDSTTTVIEHELSSNQDFGTLEDSTSNQIVNLDSISYSSASVSNDAVSIALSLSNITSTPSIVTLAAPTSESTFLDSSHEHAISNAMVTVSKSADFSLAPATFQPSSVEHRSLGTAGDSSQTNDLTELNSGALATATIELSIQNNDLLSQTEIPVQEDEPMS